MIITKLKDKGMVFTSHNLGALKLKETLEAIPADKLTDAQKRYLANAAVDSKGIITARDVQEMKKASVAAPLPIPKEFVKAPANKQTIASFPMGKTKPMRSATKKVASGKAKAHK